MIQQRPAPNTQVDRPAIMTPPAQSPAVQSPTATPLFRNVPVTQPTTNSFPPRVKTIRAIRAETGQGEILIPNKIELRVLGREGSDLLVSYNGWTVTIPASAVSSTARWRVLHRPNILPALFASTRCSRQKIQHALGACVTFERPLSRTLRCWLTASRSRSVALVKRIS